MKSFIWLLLAVAALIPKSIAFAATHNIRDGFNFSSTPVNPNNGWTYADPYGNALSTYTTSWNVGDFGAGQPGWAGPAGAAHTGWARLTEDNALASGKDVVVDEVVTHGLSSVGYTPSASLGDPFTGHHSVSITGTLHNIRELGRGGEWSLLRNNSQILASGKLDDTTLSYLNGPLNLAEGATYVNAALATVNGNQFTQVSYQPGDSFNLIIGTNDFAAVDLTFDTFAATGKGFGAPVPQVAYYRFEEPTGIDVVDSLSGNRHGSFVGVPTGSERSSDVPGPVVPRTGAANLRSADLRQGGYVLFNASEFIFNNASAGGPDGDATLEWFMKVPNDSSPEIPAPNGHTGVFWTSGLSNYDRDRFNIFWDANFTGGANSDRYITGDFKTNAGASVIDGSNYNNGNPLSEDVWHHVAIVRTDNTPQNPNDFSFTWNWYIDGELSINHTAITASPTPSLDAFGWTLAGRPNSPFYALIDEVRMTADKLTPDQFLNASAAVEGDYDGDLDVDGNDFLVWQRGQSPNSLGPGDLADWRANFGAGVSATSFATPEPAGVFLAAIAGLAGLRLRRVMPARVSTKQIELVR